MNELRKLRGSKQPVGTVGGGNGADVVIRVDENFPGTANLVRTGVLTGLSLTTVSDSIGVRPFEVALTADPARGSAAKLDAEYKGTRRLPITKLEMSAEGATQSDTAAPAVEEQTPLEAAVATMPEQHRDNVLKRFNEYEEKISALEAASRALSEEKTNLAKVAEFKEADRQILERQLGNLLTKIKEITGFNREEEVKSMLNNKDETMHAHGLSQLVAACSSAFDTFTVHPAAVPAAPAEPTAKRARVEGDGVTNNAHVRNLLRAHLDI